jgi:chromosome partitioning protein
VRDVHALCAKQIASLGGPPDWIIIDTPPSMSVFTRGGLSAAEFVIAPLRPRTSSLAGTRNMLQTLRTANALMGTEARFLGGVITHWDDLDLSNTALRFAIIPAISQFGGQVLQTRIPIDNRLETLQPGAATGGATAYGALAEEVLRYAE